MEKKIRTRVTDTRIIDITDDYAVDLWAREFNVSGKQLMAAVEAVGNAVPDVKRVLKK